MRDKLFLLFILFILLPIGIAQKSCGDSCTYNSECDKSSECPACLDDNGYLVGPNGQTGHCQPYYHAPEVSDIAFYGLIAFGVLAAVYFVKKKLKKK